MKICFISLDAYPLFSRGQQSVQGGAEVDVYMLSTESAKDQRFKVSFITGDYGQNDVEVFENVTIYKTLALQSPIAAALSLWRTLCRVDADIYFKKGASLVTTLIALFCRIHHKSFILRTSHKTECDGSYIHSQLLKGWAYRWALKTAKYVFVQNTQDCESLWKTTGVRSSAIPNGHRAPNSFAGERKWILWVGRSVAFKRPELFIRLAQAFPSEQFIMICQWAKGDKNFNKPVEQNKLVEEIKNAPNLKFIEHVPFHQIDAYFEGAKLFVNTSDAEGFPNVFIQACKCRTPILSLNVNPDSFIDRYKCGFCAQGDWHRFKEMMVKLLEPKVAEQYGNNGRQYFEETHNIEKIIQAYKPLFQQIVDDTK